MNITNPIYDIVFKSAIKMLLSASFREVADGEYAR